MFQHRQGAGELAVNQANWNSQEDARPCLVTQEWFSPVALSHVCSTLLQKKEPGHLQQQLDARLAQLGSYLLWVTTKGVQLKVKKTTQCSKSEVTEKYSWKQNLVQKSWEGWQEKMLSETSERINKKSTPQNLKPCNSASEGVRTYSTKRIETFPERLVPLPFAVVQRWQGWFLIK